MGTYKELQNKLSEIEISRLLKIYPPEAFVPFDPERMNNHRLLKMDLLPYTTLYIFVDNEDTVKVYSSSDMAIISKDTLLAYIANDLAIDELLHTLDRYPYPVKLPSEPFLYKTSIDLTSQLIGLESLNEDELQLNLDTSIYGDTLPMFHANKTVNFMFVSQPDNSYHLFNNHPGIHHTIGLRDAERLIINFDPLLSYQNDPEEGGYITAPLLDNFFSRYLKKIIEDLNKPFAFNLHTANDYFMYLQYLFNSHDQVHEKLELVNLCRQRNIVELLIDFKTDLPMLKRRSAGIKINEAVNSQFSYNEAIKGNQESQLNLSTKNLKNFMSIQSEMKGSYLSVRAYHSISIYKTFIELFFGDQPIERLGTSVS